MENLLARIVVQGGNGGNGVIRFTRLKYNAKAGPGGGSGGNGGHVILKGRIKILTWAKIYVDNLLILFL